MQIVIIGSGIAGISFAEKYRALSADDDDCMGRYFAPCKICIPHIPVGYAGGRATQGAVAGDKVCVRAEVTAEFDGLIVACGFKPRTELAELAGLEIDRGIKVNQQMQTSDESIYALGDVAELPNGKLYAFILPIRNQALWLAEFLAGQQLESWTPPVFTTKAKVHGFNAVHPYNV